MSECVRESVCAWVAHRSNCMARTAWPKSFSPEPPPELGLVRPTRRGELGARRPRILPLLSRARVHGRYTKLEPPALMSWLTFCTFPLPAQQGPSRQGSITAESGAQQLEMMEPNGALV